MQCVKLRPQACIARVSALLLRLLYPVFYAVQLLESTTMCCKLVMRWSRCVAVLQPIVLLEIIGWRRKRLESIDSLFSFVQSCRGGAEPSNLISIVRVVEEDYHPNLHSITDCTKVSR